MVLSRDVEIGSPVSSILNMGSAATLVMMLGDIIQVFVRGKVDEADVGVVRPASRLDWVETFKISNLPVPYADFAIGRGQENVVTFEVRVSIMNSSGELRANMTANAEIVLDEPKGTLIVPESAVVYDAKRNASVDIPAPGVPKGRQRKEIRVGVSNGTRTEVVEGLKQGETVILQ
jgi:HlyD family secretion protein